ncbi:unnamed protein product [Clonostachys rosea f. rosea IK726]|uniref:Alpha/beta hydrolase fold-3 domain-containing protein n=2 Tax=Bionectria ochroleuca TaxID=29856 RepID=A0A8H7K674_BIOOC|nr:unnamed protein product [Clonostachys rosea f. rosea IK726]
MAPIWSRQPFKATYIAFTLLIKIPLLLVLSPRFLFPTFRPLPTVTFRITLFARLVREYILFQAQTRSNDRSGVEASQSKAKDRFANARTGDAILYTDILEPTPIIKPAEVGGLWYPGPPSSSGDLKNEKVVLHFPGGAFVIACGSDMNGRMFSPFITKDLKADRLFLAQYRVAEGPDTRFPAALQDLVTFYNYILSLGYRPCNVIISGDSAAGNLTIGLLRYLEQTAVLPLPAGAMLWSPWTHVTKAAGQDYLKETNADADILASEVLQWGADAYLPENWPSEKVVPYISPLHHPFRTSVPVFIHSGKAEGFCDTIRAFAEEMSQVEGNRVRLHETDMAPHNSPFSHLATGLTAAIQRAFEDARDFFDD